MALNPNYVPLTPLWEVFTDKDLLTFLSDGYVKFYVDTARTVGKSVYQLTGSPPNYTYTQYGFLESDGSWRVNMNLQGAFDEVIYGYPLDEFGNVQLYFADFFNSEGVFQFSREGFPNFFEAGGTITNPVDINYIPDGQFRLHTDIPPTLTLLTGQVRDAVTNIAFGGWTFERPSSSNARDFIRFQRIGSFVTNPLKSPRYAVRVTSESPHAGDTFKDLRVKFDDVNKFSSDDVMYTFSITGMVVSGATLDVDLVIIKNFGTGGDTTTETTLTTFTITNVFTANYFSFSFGANTGKIIGPFDDDYIQIVLRFPSNELFDVEFTDALLTPGNVFAPTFNDTPTRKFLYESLFDDTNCPPADGSAIGLPLVLTKTGLRFDASQVGCIFAYGAGSVPYGFLPADGLISYDASLHSPDGIPYSRLGTIYKTTLFAPASAPLTYSVSTFSSGPQFLTTSILTNLDLRISTNIEGAAAVASDGLAPTGFSFRGNRTGDSTIKAKAYSTDGATIYIICNEEGVGLGIDTAGIGATHSTLVSGPNARTVYSVKFTSVGAGQFFTFITHDSTKYVVWYKLDGVGVAPAIPGAVFIEIDFFSTPSPISAQDVANITADAISGRQITEITTLAAPSIPQSSYFDVGTISQAYYVWYNKGGSGVDPALPGKTGIEIKLLGSETKDQVTSATATQLNTRYFSTPDLRGIFLKGYDGSSSQDLGATFRYANNSILYGDTIGSREYSNNISHSHDVLTSLGGGLGSQDFLLRGIDLAPPSSLETGYRNKDALLSNREYVQYNGSSESRPENIYVNYIIKY